jgi:hypothetical protein
VCRRSRRVSAAAQGPENGTEAESVAASGRGRHNEETPVARPDTRGNHDRWSPYPVDDDGDLPAPGVPATPGHRLLAVWLTWMNFTVAGPSSSKRDPRTDRLSVQLPRALGLRSRSSSRDRPSDPTLLPERSGGTGPEHPYRRGQPAHVRTAWLMAFVSFSSVIVHYGTPPAMNIDVGYMSLWWHRYT